MEKITTVISLSPRQPHHEDGDSKTDEDGTKEGDDDGDEKFAIELETVSWRMVRRRGMMKEMMSSQ